jgi:hypothetical protein
MPRLKKGASFSIGGRTLRKEISAAELKLLEAHIKEVNANPKLEKKKSLEDYLEPAVAKQEEKTVKKDKPKSNQD